MTAYRGRSVGCPGVGLRVERSALTAPQKAADGIVGTRKRAESLNGGEESWPAVEREMASAEVLGFAPGIWDELAAGTPATDVPVGVMTHPDSIHRTAVFVTRTYGGVGGGRPRGPSLSRFGRQADRMMTVQGVGFRSRRML
jgi:hypothetical protein